MCKIAAAVSTQTIFHDDARLFWLQIRKGLGMRYIDRNRAFGQQTHRWDFGRKTFVCVLGCEGSAVRTERSTGRERQEKRRECGFRIRCCRDADTSYIL